MQISTPRFIPTQEYSKCPSKLPPSSSKRRPRGQGLAMGEECGHASTRVAQSEALARRLTGGKARVDR